MSRLQRCSVVCRLAGSLANQSRSLSAAAQSNRLLFQSFRTAHTDKTVYAPESLPLDTGRPRLVVLGTGWAAARLCRDIDPKLYDITVRTVSNCCAMLHYSCCSRLMHVHSS